MVLILPLLALANLQAFGQLSAITNADPRLSLAVLIEARVLGIPAADLNELGLLLPESASGVPDSPTGFAVVLSEDEARALVEDSRTKTVHSLKLSGAPGDVLKFRVDTRAPVDTKSPVENPAYFEVGLALEITPSTSSNRNIALSTASTVQIRRGPGPSGGVVPILFETQPIKHEIQIPAGKAILLGGFLTATNSTGLPQVPMIEGNPVLGYVLSRSPKKADDPEIVVLLTPRLLGETPATPSALPAATIPVLVSDTAPKLDVSTPDSPPAAPQTAASQPDAAKPVQPPTVVAPPDSHAPKSIPAATPAVVPATLERFYSVQVGAFGSSEKANALAAELKKKFDAVFLDKASSGPTPFRVRVGRLSGAGAANRLRSQLKELGFDSFVVTPDSH